MWLEYKEDAGTQRYEDNHEDVPERERAPRPRTLWLTDGVVESGTFLQRQSKIENDDDLEQERDRRDDSEECESNDVLRLHTRSIERLDCGAHY